MPDVEAMWISVNSIHGKILVCCCYRPPDQKEFWNNFQSCLDEVKNDQIKNIFILGDLNADFSTPNGRKLTDFCQMQNLEILIREPTRITNTNATVLDQILTNASNFVKDVNVSPPISGDRLF